MKRMLFAAVTVAMVVVYAEIKEVTGYGTGDTLVEAMVVAQGDAVLNAGGRVKSSTLVKGDKVVSDGGICSNSAYIVNWEVTEKGESFDGAYVRIKAKTSQEKNFILKDGRTALTGMGVGVSPFHAEFTALGDLIFKSGAKVDVLGQYENDTLVKDELTFVGAGYVDCPVIDVSAGEDKACIVTAKGTVSSAASAGKETGQVNGKGHGNSKRAAYNAAWANLLSHARTGVSARRKYVEGRCMSEEYSLKGVGVVLEDHRQDRVDGGRFAASVNAKLIERFSTIGSATRTVHVRGLGDSETSAIEDAKKNAIDKVFGRKLVARVNISQKREPRVFVTGESFADGYVEGYSVKNKNMVANEYEVEISATVKQHGFGDEGTPLWKKWWVWALVLLMLCLAKFKKIGCALIVIAIGVIAAITIFSRL